MRFLPDLMFFAAIAIFSLLALAQAVTPKHVQRVPPQELIRFCPEKPGTAGPQVPCKELYWEGRA